MIVLINGEVIDLDKYGSIAPGKFATFEEVWFGGSSGDALTVVSEWFSKNDSGVLHPKSPRETSSIMLFKDKILYIKW